MNLELFNELMKFPLAQDPYEWKIFLKICESYLEENKIKNPIVVELGLWRDGQKEFYEQLLGAYHIGIDYSKKRSKPDIQGDTHDSKTLETLKAKLRGKPITILFIDATHTYEDVKKDFEMYSPLCDGIIAFHDTHHEGVSRLWNELKTESSIPDAKLTVAGTMLHKKYLFIQIEKTAGIGVIVKK